MVFIWSLKKAIIAEKNNTLTTPRDAVYKYFKMNSMCFYLGFATWTCDEKTAEWREMPNIDDCVSKDVRKQHPNHSS